MTIDIFQFSNVYTLRRSIQWLAEEPHVKEECDPYVTRPGQRIPDWPKLLHLYSRFRSGKTVQQWMEAYDVHEAATSTASLARMVDFGAPIKLRVKGDTSRERCNSFAVWASRYQIIYLYICRGWPVVDTTCILYWRPCRPKRRACEIL